MKSIHVLYKLITYEDFSTEVEILRAYNNEHEAVNDAQHLNNLVEFPCQSYEVEKVELI